MERGVYYNEYVSRAMQNGLSKTIKAGYDFVSCFKQRELETLSLVCQGYTTKAIADKIFLSPRTIDGYRNTLMEKLGVNNTAGLISHAITYNLVDILIQKYRKWFILLVLSFGVIIYSSKLWRFNITDYLVNSFFSNI